MIVFELTDTESHPVYRTLEVENGDRQYSFIRSIVAASINMGRPFLSQHVIKALNFQAITCLHIAAGEYRPCDVVVGPHRPPPYYRVQAAMDDMVNQVNRSWDSTDAVFLATYVLWRINNIHPFINGNGRTARAACYYVLSLKLGGIPKGDLSLPELIRRDRKDYCDHLQHAHDTFKSNGAPDLAPLHGQIAGLLQEQLDLADAAEAAAAAQRASTTPPSAP